MSIWWLRQGLIWLYLCNLSASHDTAVDQKHSIGYADIPHYSSTELYAGDTVSYRGLECMHFTFLRLYDMGTGITYHFPSLSS